MRAITGVRRGLQVAFIVCGLSFGASAAWAAPIEGEIVKFTGKRTGVLVDLRGDVSLSPGATVTCTINGKARTGTVKQITENGRALIRFNKGLPASVALGDEIKLEATAGATAGSDDAKTADAVRLTEGGYAKAYWDEVSFLAAHRKPGTRTDIDVSYVSSTGDTKSTGGEIGDNTDYAATDKHTRIRADAGYVGLGGIGGGLVLNYDQDKMNQTASQISTADTGTVDSDSTTDKNTLVQVEPYVEAISRVKTGDVGYGVGVGLPIQSYNQQHDVTIASVNGSSSPSKTTAYGLALEGLVGSNSWALILQLTPAMTGKIKQTGSADVNHKASEFGAQFETYGKRMKTRFGVDFQIAKDSYADGQLSETKALYTLRFDLDMNKFHLVPYLDYTTDKRSHAALGGTSSDIDVGIRLALAGVYAPFIALGYDYLSEQQTLADGVSQKTRLGGVKVSLGIDI